MNLFAKIMLKYKESLGGCLGLNSKTHLRSNSSSSFSGRVSFDVALNLQCHLPYSTFKGVNQLL